MYTKCFVFSDTGTAYDMTQCADDIQDGDVLVVPSEKVVGFLFKAWPVAVTEEHGSFHTLDRAVTDVPDIEPAHLVAFDSAREVAKRLGYISS